MRYAQNTSTAKEYLSGRHMLDFASANIQLIDLSNSSWCQFYRQIIRDIRF